MDKFEIFSEMERSLKRLKDRTGYRRPAASKRAYRRPLVARRAALRSARLNRQRRYANNVTMGRLGIELKYLDTGAVAPIVSSATASGGQVTPSATVMIMCPAIGDAPQSRDGKKIVAKRITIRGRIHSDGFSIPAASFPDRDTVVVGYLVKDTQCNGVLANSDLMFDNFTGGTENTPLSFRDMSSTQRFKVLKKQVWVISNRTWNNNNAVPPALAYVRGFERYFEWDVPLDEIIEFNPNLAGTTNDVVNLTKTNFIPVFFTNNAGGTPTVTYACRSRFVG